jgi:hypothetical protein
VIVSRKKIFHLALFTGCALMLPLIANRVSDEFSWKILDFVACGVLVFGCGLAYQLVTSNPVGIAYKAAAGIAIIAAFLLVWVNLAVGIIGSGPVNALYAAVPIVGAVGAAMARLRPQGMSRALFATALVMALVPPIALMLGTSDFSPGVLPVFAINSLFVLLFVGSAMLFRRAQHR